MAGVWRAGSEKGCMVVAENDAGMQGLKELRLLSAECLLVSVVPVSVVVLSAVCV